MSDGDNIDNLLGMARTAEASANNAEAMTYYNRVLEVDPRHPEAWLGKGKAAAWQSNLRVLRLTEMTVAFGHAIGAAAEAERPAIASTATHEANRVISTIYGMARKHMTEYVGLDATWPTYLEQVSQMLAALEEVRKWAPDDQTTLGNIIHLCADNIEGYSFFDRIHRVPGHVSISPTYEAALTNQRDAAIERMRELDPNYAPPAIEKAKKSDCFVVTATLGDGEQPEVAILRRYRDTILRHSMPGRAFVGTYGIVGPLAAAAIRPSTTLRHLSYRLIVAPASRAAERALDEHRRRTNPPSSHRRT